MRHFAIVLLTCFPMAAQTAEADHRIEQALISEIQQLRLAIERSTLLGARTQLALSQLQTQEATIARLGQQLGDLRAGAPGNNAKQAQLTEAIKSFEQKQTMPEYATPPKREEVSDVIRSLKLQLEEANAIEANRAAREADLATQLQAAQNQIADSRGRIAEMERALDAAIQQLLKPH